MIKNYLRKERILLFAIIALGLILKLYKINSPILDLYPVRQEQCAMIARNFFLKGFNIFNPEVDWFGPLDSTWRLELPLISYIASLLYAIFGIHEFLGRIVSIFFSLGSIFLIFRFANKLYNQRVAVYASFLFAVSPLSVYFGRAFMPDMAMIFFSIASLFYFYKWLEDSYKLDYFLALISTSLAFLTKLPSLYLCLPLLYLAYIKYGRKLFLEPLVYVFFALAILPSLFWYTKASNNMLTFYVTNKSNIDMLTQTNFYRRIFESINIFVLTPIGLFLALFGFILSEKKRYSYLLHFWLFGIIIYTLTAPEVNYVHYHYQLPFVPVFSIFAAIALDKLSNPEIKKYTIFSKLNSTFLIRFLLTFIMIIGFLSIRPCYKWNFKTYKAAKTIDTLTENDAIVIAGRCAGQAPLYYTKRKGWETNEEPPGSLSYSWASNLDKYSFPERNKNGIILNSEIELVKFLIKQGADYYFTTNMDVFKREPHFRDYMYKNFKILKEEKDFIIFDLKRK